MVIDSGRTYDNVRGYFYIPATWREEFNIVEGSEVGVEFNNGIILIDKGKRQYQQTVGVKGRITIPQRVRDQLNYDIFKIIILQDREKFILTPVTI